MKMKPEDIEKLRQAIEPIVKSHPEAYEQYKSAGHSDMRYNWDVLRASKFDVCQFYTYLNDTHINSALAHILGNSGKSTKQVLKNQK